MQYFDSDGQVMTGLDAVRKSVEKEIAGLTSREQSQGLNDAEYGYRAGLRATLDFVAIAKAFHEPEKGPPPPDPDLSDIYT